MADLRIVYIWVDPPLEDAGIVAGLSMSAVGGSSEMDVLATRLLSHVLLQLQT